MPEKYRPGDYVKVVEMPQPWEGSGEGDVERATLIGQVGVVCEVDDQNGFEDDPMLHVRFPVWWFDGVCCRNIEQSVVTLVSRPLCPIAEHHLVESTANYIRPDIVPNNLLLEEDDDVS